ncbi:MAG: hypothetical protein FJX76_08830 [Armatimonadetes bacterium]|nr:hypothetical protein [Armatimonadota bacterium]
MSIYRGIRKRWIEGDYAGSYRPGEDAVEVRSGFFRRYLGRDHVRVPNVGFRADGVARPLIIATDVLAGILDGNGQQVAGQSDGLYYANVANAEATLGTLSLLLERVREDDLLAVFPGDQHENTSYFDLNAMTTTILDPDLGKLSPGERRIVEQRFSAWIGKRLPLGIWKEIFLHQTPENPGAALIGKEARNFVPHCTEGIVEYVPDVLRLFEAQRRDIDAQMAAGALVPLARWLPVPKDGLTVDMPGDARGMGGNKLDDLLGAAFTGGYFQGDDHRHQKRAIVAGACYEYSVRLLIEHLVDADIQVVCMLSCVKGLDFFSSKLHTAHYLKELYGRKLVFTYDWLEPLLGPRPAGWDAAVQRVMQHDRAQHDLFWKDYTAQMARGTTASGAEIVCAGQSALQALRVA